MKASKLILPRCGRLSKLLRTPGRACACPGPTPQPSPEMRFSESVTSQMGGCSVSAAAGELAMQPPEGLRAAVIGTQPQDATAAVIDQTRGPIDQLLDHRLDATTLG